jgi:hypothetical protein
MGPSMHISDLIDRSTRIVELGATHSRLARSLARCGAEKQLLEVAFHEATSTELEQECPLLTGRFVTVPRSAGARANNAELLVLGPRSLDSLARFRSLRHAKWVAWQQRPGMSTWLANWVGRYRALRGEFGQRHVVQTGTDKVPGPSLVVYPVRRPDSRGPRYYIPHHLGVEGFLRELSAREIKHAVLRWFDTLPQVDPGEDIDLLVCDAHLPQVRDLLDSGPGVQAVDLYSTSGLPGADYRSLPYFPPYVATKILDGAVPLRDLCRVPAPLDHFRSMVYHALYHKGYAAGLPSRWRRWPQWSRPEHDYSAILQQMAHELRLPLSINMEELDAWLDAEAWRPPHDMLLRLAKKNSWLAAQLAHAPQKSFDDQIVVFLLRREGFARGGIDRAVALLRHEGYELLTTYRFPQDQVNSLARTLRGGNWGSGPWALSGGPPVAAIVMFDPAPVKLSRRQRKKYPFVASARLLCKERIRDQFNLGYPTSEHCNPIHSSDNGREAYDYLRVIMPDRLEEIATLAALLRERPPQRPRRAA